MAPGDDTAGRLPEPTGLDVLPAKARTPTRYAIQHGIRRGLAAAARTPARRGQAVPSPPSPSSPPAQPAEQVRLRSDHPDVDGRTPDEVAADLRQRTSRYRKLVDVLRTSSLEAQRAEREWYANLGFWGGAVELLNSAPKTDPRRWDGVLDRWRQAAEALDHVLTRPVTTQTQSLNDVARQAHAAITTFEHAYQLSRQYNREFSRYLSEFAHSAETITDVSTTARDLLFCTAVGLAVAVVAPAAAVAIGEGLAAAGVSGAALPTLTVAGTTTAAGAVGGLAQAEMRVAATVGAQAVEAITLFLQDSDRAVDALDFRQIAQEGWGGFQRGFVDGVLAHIGMGIEKHLAGYAATGVHRLLGPGGASFLALVLRRALTRAVSGGASGAVVGALDAGYRVAQKGGDLNAIKAAMREGFERGAALGTAAGTVVGGLQAASDVGVRQLVAQAGRWVRPRAAAVGMRVMTGTEQAAPPSTIGSLGAGRPVPAEVRPASPPRGSSPPRERVPRNRVRRDRSVGAQEAQPPTPRALRDEAIDVQVQELRQAADALRERATSLPKPLQDRVEAAAKEITRLDQELWAERLHGPPGSERVVVAGHGFRNRELAAASEQIRQTAQAAADHAAETAQAAAQKATESAEAATNQAIAATKRAAKQATAAAEATADQANTVALAAQEQASTAQAAAQKAVAATLAANQAATARAALDQAATALAAADQATAAARPGAKQPAAVRTGAAGESDRLVVTASNPSREELEAAEWMANQGHQVELRDPKGGRAGGGTSDLIVDDQLWDVYTPEQDRSVERIVDTMAGKASQVGSGGGVVVNFRRSRYSAPEVERYINNQIRQGKKPLRSLRRWRLMPK